MLENGAPSIKLLNDNMRGRHHNHYRHSSSVPTIAMEARLPLMMHFQVTAIFYILRSQKYTHNFVAHCLTFVLLPVISGLLWLIYQCNYFGIF